VHFVVTFKGGAPGVDGTRGRFTAKRGGPDTLEGDGRREGDYLMWTMRRLR